MPLTTEPRHSPFPSLADIPKSLTVDLRPYAMRYLMNGELRQWHGPGQTVFSPVCVQNAQGLERYPLGQYPLLGEQEAMEGLDAACRAWNDGRGAWPTLAVADRIGCLQTFIKKMQAVKAEVVKLLMWEVCKTLPDAEKEFDRTVEYIRRTIEALKELDRNASRFAIEEGIAGQIRRSPLGVVLCMGPFNYPLNETYTTLIPALIMGNTLVVKPPKQGVLLHLPLLQAFQESFPPGVVNIIFGEGRTIITPIIRSGRIHVLAFIGTCKVADLLKSQYPSPHRLRSILGLEAKNPAIILSDADLDIAVRECLIGTLSYNGQRCTALKILFVHRSIVEAFLERFGAAVNALRLGMPWEPGTQITPLAEENKCAYLDGLVQDAVGKGARIVNAGGGVFQETLYRPAIVSPITPDMQLYHVEQFGPVIPVVPFEREEEPINYVIQSRYGNQVSLFGRDATVIGRLIDAVVNQISRINLNSQCQRGPDTFPFTGRKDSAEGTLSIADALRCFSIRAMVAAKMDGTNQELIQEIVTGRRSHFLTTDFIF